MAWFLGHSDNAHERKAVAAARGGDRAAFESLKRQHGDALRRFLTRRAPAHAVEDILQETWIAAWQGIDRYKGRSGFKAWLYTIGVNKCVNHFRQRTRQSQWELAIDADMAGASAPDDYAAAEMRHVVQAALAALAGPQREVIELYYYDELTLAEIAQVLNRNLNTVKYQFYRAHAVVAGELSEIAPGPDRLGGHHKR